MKEPSVNANTAFVIAGASLCRGRARRTLRQEAGAGAALSHEDCCQAPFFAAAGQPKPFVTRVIVTDLAEAGYVVKHRDGAGQPFPRPARSAMRHSQRRGLTRWRR
jgi:hypothetical protein